MLALFDVVDDTKIVQKAILDVRLNLLCASNYQICLKLIAVAVYWEDLCDKLYLTL